MRSAEWEVRVLIVIRVYDGGALDRSASWSIFRAVKDIRGSVTLGSGRMECFDFDYEAIVMENTDSWGNSIRGSLIMLS